MSYTIKDHPPLIGSSLHGDLIFTVDYPEHTGDPVTYSNYKFVGDIYVGATMIARLKKIPDPVTNIGIFNIGNIVRNYISTTFNPSTTIISQTLTTGEFNLKVTMKFGEEYGFDFFTNLVVDSERTFLNNYNGRLFNQTTSIFYDVPATDRPATTPIKCGGNYNLIPIVASNTVAIGLTINTYNHANEFVSTTFLTVTPDAGYDMIVLNLSPGAINAFAPGTIGEYIKYFTVYFVDENIPDGVTLRFNLTCECLYEKHTLHFLNKYGGFESKDFTKVSRKTIDIEKKDFGKLPYTVGSDGIVSYKNSNKVFNESRSTYSSQFKEKLILNSDLLTDGEYAWLEQLVLSPLVYLEQDGYFFPVTIAETSYQPKKSVTDDLKNLTLSIEFGQTFNTQYR